MQEDQGLNIRFTIWVSFSSKTSLIAKVGVLYQNDSKYARLIFCAPTLSLRKMLDIYSFGNLFSLKTNNMWASKRFRSLQVSSPRWYLVCWRLPWGDLQQRWPLRFRFLWNRGNLGYKGVTSRQETKNI